MAEAKEGAATSIALLLPMLKHVIAIFCFFSSPSSLLIIACWKYLFSQIFPQLRLCKLFPYLVPIKMCMITLCSIKKTWLCLMVLATLCGAGISGLLMLSLKNHIKLAWKGL